VGSDAKLIMLFAVKHLVGMGLAGILLVMFMRSDSITAWPPPDDDGGGGGGGGNDRLPPGGPPGPGGGRLPLDDARPARVRLREPRRLTDLLPGPARRPAHDPEHLPAPRVPARGPSRRPA